MQIDPTNIDARSLHQAAEALGSYLDQTEADEQAQEAIQQKEEVADAKAEAVQQDPREADKWGVKAFAKELQSVGTGGIQDTVSSIATFLNVL